MFIEPIAHYHCKLTSKFGIPRQSGLVKGIPGEIVFTPPYRQEEAVRGLEAFDYLWVIWEFSANKPQQGFGRKLTVRPPRLGGNERVGVFASRSPFRPNKLGLSCLYINKVEMSPLFGPVIHVEGADLMDGTPIYDIKPYVAYADCHPDARCGFVDSHDWKTLQVDIPESLANSGILTPEDLEGLRQVLSLDPRPHYHDDPERIYGMPYAGHDIRFQVTDGTLHVVSIH